MWWPGRLRSPMSAILGVALLVAACQSTTRPPAASVRPDGFPTGVFTKTVDDPLLGPLRLYWVFEADGDWAEVPEATAGQTLLSGPARGRYVVEGDLVTIDVDLPTFWGWHRHVWRLETDRLITRYDDSEMPGDADFFEVLDAVPWVRVP